MLSSLGSLLLAVTIRVIKYCLFLLISLVITLSFATREFPPRIESIQRIVQKVKNFRNLAKKGGLLNRIPAQDLSEADSLQNLGKTPDEVDLEKIDAYYKNRAMMGEDLAHSVGGGNEEFSSENFIQKQNEKIKELSETLKIREQEIYHLKLQIGRMQKQLHPTANPPSH